MRTQGSRIRRNLFLAYGGRVLHTRQRGARVAGRDPLAIDATSRDMVTYVGFHSTGAESRACAAIDLALWDLFCKAG